MSDRYAYARSRVAARLAEFNAGAVTLTRSTFADPEPETPWLPGAATTEVFELDARVDGVTGDYIDGVTIVATDLMVIASPRARDSDGDVVDIVPDMTDLVAIDGETKAIKKIEAVPASGPAARFHIFVAS